MDKTLREHLDGVIRSIPGYPKEGIVFRDITTLLQDASAFRRSVDELVHPYSGLRIDYVAGIEARGFILGGAMAHQLSCGFIPVRKKGKLPADVISETYELEYGTDEIELHRDAIEPGQTVLLVDDLVATGGTAEASVKLLRRLGADIIAAAKIGQVDHKAGSDNVCAQSAQQFD
ncbi:MAG: adenine phosphoribosyltransferase, partial [Pseudomonadota bacterium]